MARVDQKAFAKMAIFREASRQFLEKGYSGTTLVSICKGLEMGSTNLIRYFPAKEQMLTMLVDLLCRFRWKRMEEETNEGNSSLMAICLELTFLTCICEDDPMVRELFLCAYASPMCARKIRCNNTERAKQVFGEHCPGWTDEQFAQAGILSSGIEYAMLMAADDPLSLESRISCALNNLLSIFGIPEEIRREKIRAVLALDYRNLGKQVLQEFKAYVDESNEQALVDLVKR